MFKSYFILFSSINFSVLAAQCHLVTGYVYTQGATTQTPHTGVSVLGKPTTRALTNNIRGIPI